MLAGLGAALGASAANAGDPAAAYAWLEQERSALPGGASVELIAIEEIEGDATVFTIRYLPSNELATVTCRPVFDYGWTCTAVRNQFVEREELVG
ncbi:MAG: hypothetical protein AB7O56_07260 [Bauldia sp.]